MTLVSSLRLTLAAFAMFSSLATAQTRFCLGGNLRSLPEAEQNGCRSQLQALRQNATALPQGTDWHVVLVCGEQGWQEYQGFLGAEGDRLSAARYDVNLDRHEIFLRSSQVPTNSAAQTMRLVQEITTMQDHRAAVVGE